MEKIIEFEIENDEEDNSYNKYKFFTVKNFIKYFWITLILIGALIIIGMKFTT